MDVRWNPSAGVKPPINNLYYFAKQAMVFERTAARLWDPGGFLGFSILLSGCPLNEIAVFAEPEVGLIRGS